MATAPTVVPPAGPTLSTPPSTANPTNFDAEADAFFSSLPGFQAAENLLKDNVYLNAQGTYDNALEVAANTASVSANTALAAGYAGATVWVSATVYTVDTIKYSPTDRRLYRCIVQTTSGDVTDPKLDTTKWAVVSPAQAALLVSALVQQAVSGSTYAFTNVTAQSAGTNLLLYSSQFDQATWVKASATTTADATMSTTGDTNADKIVEAAATAVHSEAQTVTTAANQPYTFSVMVKAAGRTSVVLRMDKDALNTDYVQGTFNLTTGATSGATNTGTGSGATLTSQYMGNGYWQCNLTGTPASAAGTSVRCTIFPNTNASYVGDGVQGVYVCEAQLETGTSATSRIATGAAQASRLTGVIAPSRIVFPLNPVADAFVRIFITNGIDTNIIDPNGQTIMGTNGPMKIDNNYPQSLGWQFVNSSWRLL